MKSARIALSLNVRRSLECSPMVYLPAERPFDQGEIVHNSFKNSISIETNKFELVIESHVGWTPPCRSRPLCRAVSERIRSGGSAQKCLHLHIVCLECLRLRPKLLQRLNSHTLEAESTVPCKDMWPLSLLKGAASEGTFDYWSRIDALTTKRNHDT
jgi:hypothetical protein